MIEPKAAAKTQTSLFDLHGLIAEHGAAEAVEHSQTAVWSGEEAAPTQKALTGRNGRRIADTASEAIMREHEQALRPRIYLQRLVLGRSAAPRTSGW